ncbi:hypothetical protein PAXRUDRAFT_825770, partial [Paxillus rubicundulus Ve08.2h10]
MEDREKVHFEFCLLSTKTSPNGNGTETQQRGDKANKRGKRSPDDTSRYCSGKVITPLELQAELAGNKGGKNL